MDEVYIVCKAGVEWNEIVAVYADKAHAEAARDRHELRRQASRDVFDTLSQYVIETHSVVRNKEPRDGR